MNRLAVEELVHKFLHVLQHRSPIVLIFRKLRCQIERAPTPPQLLTFHYPAPHSLMTLGENVPSPEPPNVDTDVSHFQL